MENRKKYWISRGDDFGGSPGTNEAILACIDSGYLKNVGIMVPCAHWKYQLEALIERAETIDLGLHATLNAEWTDYRWGPVLPRTEVPTLIAEDGTFWDNPNITFEKGDIEEIMAEIEAQLALLQGAGVPVRYLDTHMVFSRFDTIYERLDALCQREGLVFGDAKKFGGLRYGIGAGKDLSAEALAEAVSKTTTPAFVALHHPARRDAVSELFYRGEPSHTVAEGRHQEFEILTSPTFVSTVQSLKDVRLARYSEADAATTP